MIDDDWITITIDPSGLRKWVRRSAVTAFGTLDGIAYIEMHGPERTSVRGSEADLARLLRAAAA
jgi:hypothetical protein